MYIHTKTHTHPHINTTTIITEGENKDHTGSQGFYLLGKTKNKKKTPVIYSYVCVCVCMWLCRHISLTLAGGGEWTVFSLTIEHFGLILFLSTEFSVNTMRPSYKFVLLGSIPVLSSSLCNVLLLFFTSLKSFLFCF